MVANLNIDVKVVAVADRARDGCLAMSSRTATSRCATRVEACCRRARWPGRKQTPVRG